MHSWIRLGATRNHGLCHGEELQRRMAQGDATSCKRFGETEHEACLQLLSDVARRCSATWGFGDGARRSSRVLQSWECEA
jgi:hypothetical protein